MFHMMGKQLATVSMKQTWQCKAPRQNHLPLPCWITSRYLSWLIPLIATPKLFSVNAFVVALFAPDQRWFICIAFASRHHPSNQGELYIPIAPFSQPQQDWWSVRETPPDPKDIMEISETLTPLRLLLPYPYPLLPDDYTEIHCSSWQE